MKKKLVTLLKISRVRSLQTGIKLTCSQLKILNVQQNLTHICDQFLQTGVFPRKMKTAKVIPMYKAGDKHVL